MTTTNTGTGSHFLSLQTHFFRVKLTLSYATSTAGGRGAQCDGMVLNLSRSPHGDAIAAGVCLYTLRDTRMHRKISPAPFLIL